MDSQVDQIKNKLSVVDVVGSYVKLTKTGINYRGVCPFHSENKPSFFVSPTRQMWHCFGCGAGSSIFDFVMKIEGVEFGDALRILANKAGVELKRENPRLKTERQRLYEICELATKFFQKQLESGVGKEAEGYLLGRGISADSIKKWRLGYSPETWNSLSDFLVGKGYQRGEVVKAGLAIEKEGGGDSYDRFRGRIVFPVFDANGQVIGFGGRVFKEANKDETAKYINTPQTLLYDKSGTLYGLNSAKLAIRKKNECVITEGYTDVIMCHQAGFENTVASSGTALTGQHLTILKRYSDNLILAFDMDVAGDSATKRGISLAQQQGFNIKIIESYGEGAKKSDPAEIIAKDPAIWEQVISKTRSIMDYYFDSAFAKFDSKTPDGKREIGKVVLPAIKRLPNTIEQSHWIQRLAQLLNVKEEAIINELAKTKVDQFSEEKVQALESELSQTPKGERKALIEEKIISLIFKDPQYIQLIKEEQYKLFSEAVQHFLTEVKKIVEGNSVSEQELEKDLKTTLSSRLETVDLDAKIKNFLAALTLRADIEYEEDGQDEFLLCLLQLKNIELKRNLESLTQEIKQAELTNDSQKAQALMEEFNKLTKEL